MYCKNCGKELAEGITFCSQCGTKNDTQENAPAQNTEKPKAVSTPSPKLIAIVVSSVLAIVLIVTVILLSVSSANNTPEKVAEKFVSATFSVDPEALLDCCPDFIVRKLSQQFGLTSTNEKLLINAMKAQGAINGTQLGTVISAVRDYSFDVSEYTEDLQEEYGATYLEIATLRDACAVKTSVMVDGNMEELYVICIQLDNKWFVLDMG